MRGRERAREKVSRSYREFKGVGFHLHRRVALGEKKKKKGRKGGEEDSATVRGDVPPP